MNDILFLILFKNPVIIYSMTPRQYDEAKNPNNKGALWSWERKLDRCNHLMELMRTCLGILTVTLQIIILLKLFNYI